MSYTPDFMDTEQALLPEGPVGGNSSRVTQPFLEGASYFLRRGGTYSQIVFRVVAQAGAPTLRLLLFQRGLNPLIGGVSGGSIARVASVELFPIGAPGEFVASFAEGAVNLYSGLVFVLFGRDSALGDIILRTQLATPLDLYNDNVNQDTHPTAFTTLLPSTASPVSIDPRASPTGDLIPSVFDLFTALRLIA